MKKIFFTIIILYAFVNISNAQTGFDGLRCDSTLKGNAVNALGVDTTKRIPSFYRFYKSIDSLAALIGGGGSGNQPAPIPNDSLAHDSIYVNGFGGQLGDNIVFPYISPSDTNSIVPSFYRFMKSIDSLAALISSAPIYPITEIPFGDGSTAGGITDTNLIWNHTLKRFVAGSAKRIRLTLDSSLDIFYVSDYRGSSSSGIYYSGLEGGGLNFNTYSGVLIDMYRNQYGIGDFANLHNGLNFLVNDSLDTYVLNGLGGSGNKLVGVRNDGTFVDTTVSFTQKVDSVQNIIGLPDSLNRKLYKSSVGSMAYVDSLENRDTTYSKSVSRIIAGTNISLTTFGKGVQVSLMNNGSMFYADSSRFLHSVDTTGKWVSVNAVADTSKGGTSATTTLDARTNLRVNTTLDIFHLLGSGLKSWPVNFPPNNIAAAFTFSNQQEFFVLQEGLYPGDTIHGVTWYQAVKGAYNQSNSNESRIGLCKDSSGVLVLVASCANDTALMKTASNNTYYKKAFTSNYVIQANTAYYTVVIFGYSSVSTSPQIGNNSITAGATVADFTLSRKTNGLLAAQTSLLSTLAQSSIATNINQLWLSTY